MELLIIYLAADPNCLITRHTIHHHLVRSAVGHVYGKICIMKKNISQASRRILRV